jgi:hypothetical protein
MDGVGANHALEGGEGQGGGGVYLRGGGGRAGVQESCGGFESVGRGVGRVKGLRGAGR